MPSIIKPSRFQDSMQQQSQFNPEFKGIGHVLQKQKRKRKSLDYDEKFLSTKVSFLEKQAQKAKKLHSYKQKELLRLYKIADRKNKDNKNKHQRQILRQQRKFELQEKARKQKRQRESNKKNVMNSLHSYKSYEASRVKRNLNNSFMLKSYQNSIQTSVRQSRMTLSRLNKMQGKSKINQFFRNKNDIYVSQYKDKIQKERYTSLKKRASINILQERSQQLMRQLENKNNKIQTLQKTIKDFSKQRKHYSKDLQNHSQNMKSMTTMQFYTNPQEIHIKQQSTTKASSKANTKAQLKQKTFTEQRQYQRQDNHYKNKDGQQQVYRQCPKTIMKMKI